MLHVYAITDVDRDSLGVGLHGAPLGAVAAGGLTAIASEHRKAPRSGIEELWRHEEVVEGLMERATVLPMRFGATAAGAEELESVLRSRGEEFKTLLDQVRGAVELSVRVAPAPPAEEAVASSAGGDPARRPSGAEYMRERSRALSSREDAQRRYHEPLQALARGARVPTGRLGPGDFKAAYLVAAERVDEFTALVARLGREGEARVSCTGPWPPYSFVSGEER